ncbi:MAG: bacillithiol biosynthesis cysteine-adding enzyme BshC, partial [Myxococcota bacterium]
MGGVNVYISTVSMDAIAGRRVVVTGQQVGLFLGPLYTLHKAWTAIALARSLDAVPVFWLQTEDHDWPEIDHTAIPGDGPPVLRLAQPDPEARISVSERRCGPDIERLHAELESALGSLPYADETLSLLRRHYVPEASVSAAFAGVLAEIFEAEGLVILDPRSPDFAPQTVAVHRRAITDAAAIAEALSAAGPGQVPIRPGAPLSFFHPDGPDGPRYRLHPEGDGYRLAGRDLTISAEALLAALDAEPRCFSTSALLRPLLQDTALDTVAYVGGPGEGRYYAQLAPLYAHFGRPAPRFEARGRYRWITPRTARALKRAGLTPDDCSGDRDTLIRRMAGSEASGLEARVQDHLAAAISELKDAGADLDPGTLKTIDKAADSSAKTLSKAVSRITRALGQRDEVRVAAMDTALLALSP